MCEAATITAAIMAITAATSTAMSIKASNDQAEAQSKAASNAAASDYIQQTEQQDQTNQQAALEKTERARQAMIERAKLRVSQGEAGIGGLTPMKEMQESYMNETYDASILETNRANRIRQIEAEKEGVRANAQGRINVSRSGVTPGWAAGLQIGFSGVEGGIKGYTIGKGMK